MKRGIENLFIWKEARIVVNDIYELMKNCKDYAFKDQLQRAAISIMNIQNQVLMRSISIF